MQNFRHAYRMLRQNPGFTFVVVLILSLGIGANTAIFTLINAVLLRPLPYHDPSKLVEVGSMSRNSQDSIGCLTYPHFTLLKERNRAFSGFAGFTPETFDFTDRGEAIQVDAARVSSNFFNVLGIKPQTGRGFIGQEDLPAGNSVAIVSDRLWRQRFQSDPNISGRTISLDSKPYTIIGVLPPSFEFGLLGSSTDLWTTHLDRLNLATPQQIHGGMCYLDSVARLAPGVTATQAQSEINILDREYVAEYPKLPDADSTRITRIPSLQETLVGNVRPTFLTLFAAVAVVLLIACANVASLLLTRALIRRKEVAVRTALGATRAHLVRQFLTESLVIALASGVMGIVLSIFATHLLAQAASKVFPRISEIENGVNWEILGFALALSLLTGLLFGVGPSLHFSRPNLSGILREEARGTVGGRTRNFSRNLLVTAQIALSIVLLITAGLLIHSFIHLQTQPLGFDPQGVVTMHISLPPTRYSTPQQMIQFYDRLLENVKAIPGVEASAISSALPVDPVRRSPALLEGEPAVPLGQRPVFFIQTFTPDYLRAMKIRLIRGRFFNRHDRQDSQPVAVVNEAVARRFFAHENPIRKHIWLGLRTVPVEIVGVIGDVKNVSLSTEPQPEVDVPYSQLTWPPMNLIVRTGRNPEAFVNVIQAQVGKVDSQQSVTSIQTLETFLAAARSEPRIIVTLLSVFAGLAFLLAIIGLYGVVSYSAGQRTQEVGIRIALGATRANIVLLILRQAAIVTAGGVAAGLLASFAVTRLIRSLIYGVSTLDAQSFVAGPALFLAFALLASYLPAARATRLDPADALRSE